MVLFQLGVQRAAELEEEFVERQEGHGYAEENVGFDGVEHASDPDLDDMSMSMKLELDYLMRVLTCSGVVISP